MVIVSLDRVKRGRGPIVVTTVGATLIVVLSSSLYSMAKIQQRTVEAGVLNPTDQVLMSKHMLEASLMGTFQFHLFFMIIIVWFCLKLTLYRKNL